MSNKIAVVTGGSRGLGKNMALSLAQKGIDVILTYYSKKAEADEVVRQIEGIGHKAYALQLDVSNSRAFAAFVQQVKDVLKEKWHRDSFDFLVNNAGNGIHARFAETTEEEQFDQMMNTHLKGVLFLTQELLPLIADKGRIINISSGLTRFARPGCSACATMKEAVETLTKYPAKELGARGIAINVAAPGAIETDFGGGVVRDNKKIDSFVAAKIALGRVGLPGGIGGVIASLLSEDNRWVNAQRIEASGGMFT